jgi:hypothetical protein
MQAEPEISQPPKSRSRRILQYIGAVIVTVFALWFLFGIPGYLLFGMFFEN